MRIAIITLEFPPNTLGGAGVYLEKIIAPLSAYGHELHVFAPGSAANYERTRDLYITHRLPIRAGGAILSFWAQLPIYFARIQREFGAFDLIHSNSIADLTLSKTIFRVPRLATVHHLSGRVVKTLKPTIIQRLRHPGDETGVLPLLESFCFDRADLLVAVSQSTREDLSALLHIPTEKISVIAHGATPQDYVFPPEELNALRASLGAENCPLLLFVGRLEERKGVHILLDAFATLLKKREAILVLAGKGDRARYEALAVELGVASRVRFTGFLGDLQLRKLFAACDLFVLPSFWEGMGLVALEARSAGKFVIASAVGGLPEAVPNGSGLLVPPGDPVQLAQAILGGLSQNTVSLPPARTWAEAAEELNRLYLNLVDHVSSNLRHNVV